MTRAVRRTLSEKVLLILLVVFTVMSFFPAVPATVPGKFKVAGAIIAIAWAVAVYRAKLPVIWREHAFIAAAVLGLGLWTAASTLWATDRPTALGAAGRMAIGIALLVIVFTVARDRLAVRALIFSYVVGGVLTIAYGVIFKPGPPIAGVIFDPTRLYGGMGEPNDLGAVLLPAIALSLFGLPFVRNVIGRVALALCVVALVVGLMLSQSRGALVAAAVMLVVGVLLAGKLRVWIGTLCAVTIAVGVGYYFLFASEAIHARVNSLLRLNAYGGLSDGSGRKELWKAALGLVKEHPILGVGARNYRTVTGESLVVHNTYLEILAELGVIGLVLFLGVVIAAIVVAGRGIRAALVAKDVDGEFQARGAVVGIAGLLTAYVFISGEFQPQLWWLLGLALACGGREPAEDPPESTQASAESTEAPSASAAGTVDPESLTEEGAGTVREPGTHRK